MTRLTWFERLPDDEVDTVRALLRAARLVDGRPPVPETGPLPREFRTGRHLLAYGAEEVAGQLIGYAHLNVTGDAFGRQVAEVIVHPAHRRAGTGSRLVTELIRYAAGRSLRIWSHGDHPGAARIAEKLGLVRARELVTMRVELTAPTTPPLAAPHWPPGVTVRTFVPGEDEGRVVRVNRRAFDWHPEQSTLTVGDIEAAEREDWFDPSGFFLAVDAAHHVLGFHWTKVHPGHPPVGEVYVVGVDPSAHGMGLGRALTLAGLEYLRSRGLHAVILYVESDNQPALKLYQALGFRRVDADVQYEWNVGRH